MALTSKKLNIALWVPIFNNPVSFASHSFLNHLPWNFEFGKIKCSKSFQPSFVNFQPLNMDLEQFPLVQPWTTRFPLYFTQFSIVWCEIFRLKDRWIFNSWIWIWNSFLLYSHATVKTIIVYIGVCERRLFDITTTEKYQGTWKPLPCFMYSKSWLHSRYCLLHPSYQYISTSSVVYLLTSITIQETISLLISWCTCFQNQHAITLSFNVPS